MLFMYFQLEWRFIRPLFLSVEVCDDVRALITLALKVTLRFFKTAERCTTLWSLSLLV